MPETYYVGAYWLGRAEPRPSCARRAERFFRELAQLDPTWARWFPKARTRKAALQQEFTPDAATFEAFFEEKTHQLDDGVTLGAWNGEEQATATTVRFTCGSSSHVASDVCVLTPPSEGPVGQRVLTTSVMTAALRAMVLACEPDWGVVMSDEYALLEREHAPRTPHVGWVTYLSQRRGTVPPLPAPARIEPVEGQGTLIVLAPERFTAANPEHLDLAQRVRAYLERAGLLEPIKPW